MSGDRRGDGEAGDHHHPDDGGGSPPAARIDAAGQENEERGPRRARAHPHQEERQDGEGDAGGKLRFHEGGRRRRTESAEAERGHAADDPGRAPPAHIRAVAPARAQDLHGVVEGDEGAGDHRRQSELYDHDPVEGRGHENDHGTQGGLDEAEADDGEPAQLRRHHVAPCCARALRAKAATSMPST